MNLSIAFYFFSNLSNWFLEAWFITCSYSFVYVSWFKIFKYRWYRYNHFIKNSWQRSWSITVSSSYISDDAKRQVLKKKIVDIPLLSMKMVTCIYDICMRRDNGMSIKKSESFLYNRYVVLYNRHFLLKFNAHINVEWCNQTHFVKYLFKYVSKGHDRATASFF